MSGRAATIIICVLSVLAGLADSVVSQSVVEYRRQIGRLIQDYDWVEALRFATQGLERYPQDPQLLVAAAALMLQMGRPGGGERLIQAAASTSTQDPDLLAVMAEINLSYGDRATAIYLMKRALRYAPDNPQISYRLSSMLFSDGDSEAALKYAAIAVAGDGRSESRRFYAVLLEQAGRSEEAYEQLRLARLSAPGDARLLLRLSDTAKRKGQYNRAQEFLEMAVAIDPENPLYHQELFNVYSVLGAEGEAKGARSRADRLQEAFQSYVEAMRLVSEGRDAVAVTILEAAVDENPEFTTGAVLLADVYRKIGKKEKALNIYHEVLKREPSRARVREEAAWLYVDKGDLDTALETLRGSGPDNPNEALILGYRKLLDEDWRGAMQDFRQVEAHYPLHPKLLQQISLCLNSMGRPEEALVYLRKAQTVEPESEEIGYAAQEVRFEHGLTLEKEGKWAEALPIFSRLRNEDDERADFYFHEAYCQQHLWEYESAAKLYKRGLQLNPNTPWVRINLATCLYALSLYDEAAEQWEFLVAQSNKPEYLYNLGLARIRQWKLEEGWDLIERAANQGFEPAKRIRRAGKSF